MGYVVEAKVLKFKDTYLYQRACDVCGEEYLFNFSEAQRIMVFCCVSCDPNEIDKSEKEWLDGICGVKLIAWENRIAEADYKLRRRSNKNYKKVFQRDCFICQYCYGPGDSIDHVLPVVAGGGNNELNLVCCCLSCNAIASCLVFEGYMQKKAYLVERLRK